MCLICAYHLSKSGQAVGKFSLSFFTVRFLIAITLGAGLSVPSASLGQESVPDLFHDKRLVAYVIWPCMPDPQLVTRDRFASGFDVLGLRRPESPSDPWFTTEPSWPYRFRPSAIDILKQRFKETRLISQDSISRSQDGWGTFISFQLDEFPDFEIKRYPAFLAIVANRLGAPLASKSEYGDLHKKLAKALQVILFEEPVLGEAIQVLQEPFALIRRPLIRVTHLSDLDSFRFLAKMYEGANLKEFWSTADLVTMGAIPHSDYGYHQYGTEAFITKHAIGESIRIIVPTRPPVIPEKYHWRLLNSSSVFLERLVRFVLFLHVVVPDYVRETENTSCDEALRLARDLRASPGRLSKIQDQFELRLGALRELVRHARNVRRSLENAGQVLTGILALPEATDEESRSFIMERFRQTHSEQLARTQLHPSYVRLALRFRSNNAMYDAERVLRDAIRSLDVEAGRIEACTRSSETHFDRAVGTLGVEKSVSAARWAIWIAIGTLIINTLAGMYPEKARRVIGSLCDGPRRLWHWCLGHWHGARYRKRNVAMNEQHNDREHLARLMAAMEKHVAFLEGAMGIDMTPVFNRDDIILSEYLSGIEGINVGDSFHLAFPSQISESGWMDDVITFASLQEMVKFLENVELLVRIARAQQRGA